MGFTRGGRDRMKNKCLKNLVVATISRLYFCIRELNELIYNSRVVGITFPNLFRNVCKTPLV